MRLTPKERRQLGELVDALDPEDRRWLAERACPHARLEAVVPFDGKGAPTGLALRCRDCGWTIARDASRRELWSAFPESVVDDGSRPEDRSRPSVEN